VPELFQRAHESMSGSRHYANMGATTVLTVATCTDIVLTRTLYLG
jgi:hypothetical protein